MNAYLLYFCWRESSYFNEYYCLLVYCFPQSNLLMLNIFFNVCVHIQKMFLFYLNSHFILRMLISYFFQHWNGNKQISMKWGSLYRERMLSSFKGFLYLWKAASLLCWSISLLDTAIKMNLPTITIWWFHYFMFTSHPEVMKANKYLHSRFQLFFFNLRLAAISIMIVYVSLE